VHKSGSSPTNFAKSPHRKVPAIAPPDGWSLSSQQYADIIKCGVRDVLNPLTEAVIGRAALNLDKSFDAHFWGFEIVLSRTDRKMLVQALTMPGKDAKNRAIKILKSLKKLHEHYRFTDIWTKKDQKQSPNVFPAYSRGNLRCVDCKESIKSEHLFLKMQEDEDKMRAIRIQSQMREPIASMNEEFTPIHLQCWFGNLIWDQMKGFRSARTHLIKQKKCAQSFLRASYPLKPRMLTTEKDLRSIHSEWITDWRLSTDINKDATWSYEKEIAAYSNICILYAIKGALTIDSLNFLFADFLNIAETKEVLTSFYNLKSNAIENLTTSRLVLVTSENTKNLGSLDDLSLGMLQICITQPLKENEMKRLLKLGFSVKNLGNQGFVVSRQSLEVTESVGR
jgi:hypothetical protein